MESYIPRIPRHLNPFFLRSSELRKIPISRQKYLDERQIRNKRDIAVLTIESTNQAKPFFDKECKITVPEKKNEVGRTNKKPTITLSRI